MGSYGQMGGALGSGYSQAVTNTMQQLAYTEGMAKLQQYSDSQQAAIKIMGNSASAGKEIAGNIK